jgi:hypothetical protein
MKGEPILLALLLPLAVVGCSARGSDDTAGTEDHLESAGDDGAPNDPFDPASCIARPGLTRDEAMALIGSEPFKRLPTSTKIMRRTRTCTPSAGCPAWGAPSPLVITLGTPNGDVPRPIDVHLALAVQGQSTTGPGIKFIIEEDSVPSHVSGGPEGITFDLDRGSETTVLPYFIDVPDVPSRTESSLGHLTTSTLSITDHCARFDTSESSPDFTTPSNQQQHEYAALFRF